MGRCNGAVTLPNIGVPNYIGVLIELPYPYRWGWSRGCCGRWRATNALVLLLPILTRFISPKMYIKSIPQYICQLVPYYD